MNWQWTGWTGRTSVVATKENAQTNIYIKLHSLPLVFHWWQHQNFWCNWVTTVAHRQQLHRLKKCLKSQAIRHTMQLLWDDTLCALPAFNADSRHKQMRENMLKMLNCQNYSHSDEWKCKIYLVWPYVFGSSLWSGLMSLVAHALLVKCRSVTKRLAMIWLTEA